MKNLKIKSIIILLITVVSVRALIVRADTTTTTPTTGTPSTSTTTTIAAPTTTADTSSGTSTTPTTDTPSSATTISTTTPATTSLTTPAVTATAPVVAPTTPDTTPPTITLTGDASISIIQDTPYTDAGATATDDVDGDITSKIVTTGSVNIHIPNTYTLTYSVSDTAGNAALPVTRTIIVTPLTIKIHLTAVTDTKTLYDQDETVSSCPSSPGSSIYTVSGYCAVIQSGLTNDWTWSGTDAFLNSLGGVANDFSHPNTYWGFFHNLTYASDSLSAHTLTAGEQILLEYNTNPLKLTVSNVSPAQHDTVTLTLTQFGLDSSFNPIWTPAASGSITVNGTAHAVGSDGTFSLTLDTASPYTISATETGFSNSNTIVLNPTPAISNETILIRNGDTVVYQGTPALPATGTVSIVDDTGATHSINADSVLGLLSSLASSTNAFSLSDIQYYAPGTMGPTESFYLKCITPSGSSALCQNWQYVVNGTAPMIGIDSTILTGGENIGIYFGNPHQVILNTTSITVGGSLTATAQKYNYVDNTWGALTGVTIGATQPNPNDPYTPTVITSAAVDANGAATLTLTSTGTYNIGIADDYYFPAYPVTVTAIASGGGGGGGGGGIPSQTLFSVPNARAYLASVQSPDGSFGGSDMYTDWAAIALGSTDTQSDTVDINTLKYMSAHATVSSVLTDNERHAMALLALGQNPYSFNGTDYITPIVNSFDGTQFGDPSLINDDIFALIPLSSAGYTIHDAIISKDIAFIVSKQNSDGSWSGGVDMTAAAIEALELFNSADGVPAAIAKATTYMQTSQASDGGFGTVYSTSWAAGAMSALNTSWTNSGHTISDYFALQQASDGAALPSTESIQNRIWATSYAIPAVLGKAWSTIMHAVAKPTPVQITSSSSSNNNSSSSGGGGGGLIMLQQIPPVAPVVPQSPVTVGAVVAPTVTVAIQTPVPPTPTLTQAVKSISVSGNVAVKHSMDAKVLVATNNLKTNTISPTKPLLASAIRSGVRVPTPVVVVLAALCIILVYAGRRFYLKP